MFDKKAFAKELDIMICNISHGLPVEEAVEHITSKVEQMVWDGVVYGRSQVLQAVNELKEDRGTIIPKVHEKIDAQQAKGLQKYGEYVTSSSYTLSGWLRHLQQELIDGVMYVEAALEKLEVRAND